jgi:hypothetical protein
MPYGDRKSQRVDFERGIHTYIMGLMEPGVGTA